MKSRTSAQIRSHAQKYIIKLCKKFSVREKNNFKHFKIIQREFEKNEPELIKKLKETPLDSILYDEMERIESYILSIFKETESEPETLAVTTEFPRKTKLFKLIKTKKKKKLTQEEIINLRSEKGINHMKKSLKVKKKNSFLTNSSNYINNAGFPFNYYNNTFNTINNNYLSFGNSIGSIFNNTLGNTLLMMNSPHLSGGINNLNLLGMLYNLNQSQHEISSNSEVDFFKNLLNKNNIQDNPLCDNYFGQNQALNYLKSNFLSNKSLANLTTHAESIPEYQQNSSLDQNCLSDQFNHLTNSNLGLGNNATLELLANNLLSQYQQGNNIENHQINNLSLINQEKPRMTSNLGNQNGEQVDICNDISKYSK